LGHVRQNDLGKHEYPGFAAFPQHHRPDIDSQGRPLIFRQSTPAFYVRKGLGRLP
jgi:hypothetical protein